MKRLSLLFILFILSSVAFAKSDKISIGVPEFKNETRAYWWKTGVGTELASMLANELVATKSFKVVEREKLGHVLQEQDLAAAGRIKQDKRAAKTGELTGAQYLIMGTVSAYEENTKGTGGGVSFKGFSLGGKKKESYIAIDLRAVNSTTGEVEFVRTVEARSSDTGMSFGVSKGGFGGALATEKKTPAGKAIRAVIIEATDYLSCVMVDKDGCEAEYDAKESKRRAKTKDSIKLD